MLLLMALPRLWLGKWKERQRGRYLRDPGMLWDGDECWWKMRKAEVGKSGEDLKN